MSRTIHVINGPNLNLLGTRQTDVYGTETLADIEAECREAGAAHGLDIVFRQSNAEHEIIDWIHEARAQAAGIVINPAAYSHTSVAILDALKTCTCPIIEVHVSNIHSREAFRHHSYVSRAATGVIAGLGTAGYAIAVAHVARLIGEGSAPTA